MLKTLTLVNFRGLRRLEVELDPVTALLGPNSAGKTSVLHAVRLACELLERALRSDFPATVRVVDGVSWIVVTEGTLLADSAALLSLADWQALFVDQAVGEDVALTLELGFEPDDPIQALYVQVSCARNQQLKLGVRVRADAADAEVAGLARKSPLRNRRLTEYLQAHSPRAVLVPPFYGTVPAEELRSRAVIDRLLGSGDQSHVVRNLVAGLGPEQFERLSRFLFETLGARLVTRTSGDALQAALTLRVTFADSNGELELSAAGAGLVNLVALYAALSRWGTDAGRTVLFLLDEPEAHLSPRVQADSAERVARLVTQEFRAQLLLATHSVDILNRLSEVGARLVRVDRTADPCATVLRSEAELFGDLAGWADLTPYTAINALASRRILFVEGEDERALLPRLGELRFANDPERRRRLQRWAVVPLEGAGNVPLAKLLAQLLQSAALRPGAQAGAFELLVVLDRDYERRPGLSELVQEGAGRAQQLVWSQHSLESLLLSAPVLTRWVRGFLGAKAPPDLEARVQEAVAAADRDPALNDDAIARLQTGWLQQALREGTPLSSQDGARQLRERHAALAAEVRAAPAVWQRGKDRARFILGHLKAALPPAVGGRLPADVLRLVKQTPTASFGWSLEVIPPEINTLLELLAQPDAPSV